MAKGIELNDSDVVLQVVNMVVAHSQLGFDDPVEILKLCHGQVRRFAQLCTKLNEYLISQAADKSAGAAATSILRYFNMAAPLHHADEELDLFPALMKIGKDSLDEDLRLRLDQAIQDLEREHVQLSNCWIEIRIWLENIESGCMMGAPACLESFIEIYLNHADREETEIYIYAKHIAPEDLSRISRNMVSRRRTTATAT